MNNKEKITYLVLKTFYDNIPHNKHFGLKFTAIWIMFFLIDAVVFWMMPFTIISLLLFLIFFIMIIKMLCGYCEIKDWFLSTAINDDYMEKVMDKIKHQFSSKNNIHLENISDYTEYPEDVQVVINDLIKNLTSKQDLATYNDIIKLYEEKAEKYEEHEEKVKKYNQTEMMEKYVK